MKLVCENSIILGVGGSFELHSLWPIKNIWINSYIYKFIYNNEFEPISVRFLDNPIRNKFCPSFCFVSCYFRLGSLATSRSNFPDPFKFATFNETYTLRSTWYMLSKWFKTSKIKPPLTLTVYTYYSNTRTAI